MTISDEPIRIRADRRPLYMQAEEALAELLANSEPGDQLPSEPDLARRLGISRTTLREAIRAFEKRGVVARKPGVGTFVQMPHPVIESGLEKLESIETLAARLGLITHVSGLEVGTRAASEHEASALQLPAASPVLAVTRSIFADREPIAFLEDVLPQGTLTETDLESFRGSVLDILLKRGDLQLSHTRTDLTAEAAPEALAKRLELTPGTPLLLLKSLLYIREGNVIDYSHSYFVPGHFKFHVVRRVGEV